MKIKQLSDLHLEGYDMKYSYDGEDVLILSGDIHTRNRLDKFLIQIPSSVKILCVIGNHEFYHSLVDDVISYHTELETKFPNFHFLNNSSTKIDDINFFGGTMFTQFTLYGITDVLAQFHAERGINDFILIRVSDDPHILWKTQNHIEQHEIFRRELAHWIKETEGQKRVVISHFAPHPITVDPKYGSNVLNSYFTENMEEFMGWEGIWFYGHTHSNFDGMIGETRIISNQRGYGNESVLFNPNFIVEV
jgi:hypothetical protein